MTQAKTKLMTNAPLPWKDIFLYHLSACLAVSDALQSTQRPLVYVRGEEVPVEYSR